MLTHADHIFKADLLMQREWAPSIRINPTVPVGRGQWHAESLRPKPNLAFQILTAHRSKIKGWRWAQLWARLPPEGIFADHPEVEQGRLAPAESKWLTFKPVSLLLCWAWSSYWYSSRERTGSPSADPWGKPSSSWGKELDLQASGPSRTTSRREAARKPLNGRMLWVGRNL